MKKTLISILSAIALSINLISIHPLYTIANAATTYETIDTEDVLNIDDVDTTITLGNNIKIDGIGATVENNIVTITSGGTYSISGNLDDGQIIVDSEDKNKVQILLNGVNITSSTTSPIYIKNAKKTIITLADNSTNTVSDSTNYIYENEDEDEPDAAIFSKDDLIINGTGSLIVNGNYNTGIRSKDDLTIESGNITVNSVDDGIKGKDSLTILDGTFTINSGSDGLKSTNSSNETKGYVRIDGGLFNITSSNDGIQAESNVIINGGIFNILSGNDSEYGENHTNNFNPIAPPDGNFPPDGQNPPELPDGSDGSTPPTSPDGNNGTMTPEIPSENEGNTPPTPSSGIPPENVPTDNNTSNTTDTNETTSESKKGIKAIIGIEINDGTFNLNCADDALHCDSTITINSGDFTIKTGDDGIHAENTLDINNGSINITECYEGLEGNSITINNGNIKIVSSDDGINSTKTTETDSDNANISTTSLDNAIITINGGYILVDSTGDGIDSNGSIYINGGTTIINGTESNNDAALDYDEECLITNGTLIAVGNSAMAQTPSNTSTQNVISLTLSTQNANTLVHIESEDGENILTFSPTKKYSSVVISSPNIKTGTTYKAYTGGTTTGTSIDGLYNDGSYSNGTEIGSITVSNIISKIIQEGINTGGRPGGYPGDNNIPPTTDDKIDDDNDNTTTNDNSSNSTTITNTTNTDTNTNTSSTKSNSKKTGDTIDILLYLASLLTGGIALILSVRRKLIINAKKNRI